MAEGFLSPSDIQEEWLDIIRQSLSTRFNDLDIGSVSGARQEVHLLQETLTAGPLDAVRACLQDIDLGNRQAGYPGLARNLPRLLSFGWAISTMFHRHLGGPSERLERTGRAGAIFNAFICCIDRIWDEEQAQLPLLNRILTEQTLAAAYGHQAPGSRHFSQGLSADDPLLLTVLFRLFDAFIVETRVALAESAGESWQRALFLASLLTLYRGHKQSSTLRLADRIASPAVAHTLREVSAGPFRVMAQLSLIGRKESDPAQWPAVSRQAMEIGEIFQWTDDLVDCFEDLDQGRWNAVWLAFAQRGGRLLNADGRPRQAGRLLVDLQESGVVELVTTQIAGRLRSLTEAEASVIGCWIGSWLG